MYGPFNSEIGQLLPAERTALHEMVLQARPKICVEVGTWKGAGSTLQIVSALDINQQGFLHTCEPDAELHNIATQYYNNHGQQFLPRIALHKKTSTELIQELINQKTKVDFFFADGPEDPDLAVRDFKMAESIMEPGSIFAAHDWLNDESVKVSKLKSVIGKSDKWMLYSIVTPPESVGLVFFKRI